MAGQRIHQELISQWFESGDFDLNESPVYGCLFATSRDCNGRFSDIPADPE